MSKWRRVNQQHKCPICQHDSWCSVSSDGAVVHCMRTESPKRAKDGGFLHFDQSAAGYTPPPERPQRRVDVDWTLVAQRAHAAAITGDHLARLSAKIGLAESTLEQFGVGWLAAHEAWSFPMRDSDGRIIGIRTRFEDGSKRALMGSRSGLFFVGEAQPAGVVFVVEGATDAIAVESLGLSAIGRPSCLGQEDMLAAWVHWHQLTHLIVIPDNDDKPQTRRMVDLGVRRLISAVARHSCKVRVSRLPCKDAREFVNRGGTRAELLALTRGTDSERSAATLAMLNRIQRSATEVLT